MITIEGANPILSLVDRKLLSWREPFFADQKGRRAFFRWSREAGDQLRFHSLRTSWFIRCSGNFSRLRERFKTAASNRHRPWGDRCGCRRWGRLEHCWFRRHHACIKFWLWLATFADGNRKYGDQQKYYAADCP